MENQSYVHLAIEKYQANRPLMMRPKGKALIRNP